MPATRFTTVAEARTINLRLLEQIRTHEVPATGFVNEGKLEIAPADLRELLAAWLDAGLDLGNHTYSHLRLHDVPLEQYQADVKRGGRVTRELMATRGRRPRYFRHPTLNTGPDLRTKQAFEQFLAGHGYSVAPVTIDNDEYLYALAYDRARARRDTLLLDRLGRDYIRYMEEVFQFFEVLSTTLLGREPAQVLLLHANALNAEYFEDLGRMMKGRGYRFVALEEALRDHAYALPDRYIGARGPSWLIRWAITQGRDPGEPPRIPPWVRVAAQ